MAQFKLNISEKSGKSKQQEISEEASLALIGKKIGDKVSGDSLGFPGYEFEVTGGSDDSGIPMRSDLPGVSRRRILAVEGIGLKKKDAGVKQRKLIAGNTIHEKTAQVNVKVAKKGKENIFAEPVTEEPAADAPAKAAN